MSHRLCLDNVGHLDLPAPALLAMANNAARIKRHAARNYNLGECGLAMLVSIIRHYSPCWSTRPARARIIRHGE